MHMPQSIAPFSRTATEKPDRIDDTIGFATGHKIAQANIRRKARDDLPIALFIPERVVLIEKIAQYAAEKVV